MPAGLDELEQALDYTFQRRELLTRAVTHSSRAHEAAPGQIPLDNERLEFLGDSVLGWIVSEWLFRHYPDYNEGQLSLLKNHLVSANYLLAAAHKLDLGRYLHLGRGEESAGGRGKQRLLVNAFEAVVAAVYLDGGPEAARGVLLKNTIPGDDELARLAGSGPPQDFRAELERITLERKLPRPHYAVLNEAGPGHSRVFTVEVRVGNDIAAKGEGSSKKIASHNAAREVCRRLK